MDTLTEKQETKAATKEVAEQEVNKWLDYRDVTPGQRETFKDSIKLLVEGVEKGVLSIDGEFLIKQKLKFKIGEKVPVTELEFKPRIRVGTIHGKSKEFESTDATGNLFGIITALTGQAIGIVKDMDQADYKYARAIAVFFM